MAFADYLDLRTAVLEEARRPDLADVFGRLTQLAETRLNRVLRTRKQITETTLTFASNVATLPSDFAAAIGLYDGYGCEYLQKPYQNTERTYQGYTYAIDGSSVVGPTGTLTFHYYAKLPTLTTSMTTTNWLLDDHPHAYLYAVSEEVAKHARDVEGAQAFRALLDDELTQIRSDDNRARYSRAQVRVAGVRP